MLSKKQLRCYQKKAIESIFKYFKSGKKGNPLIASPTGTGKGTIIAALISEIIIRYKNQRILCLTHVKELVQQNYNDFCEYAPDLTAGIFCAGLNRKEALHNVTFGSIGSVVNKAKLFGKIDLIIIDEAHLLSPNDTSMYQKLISYLLSVNPHLKIIGLTATPFRLGQGMLTDNGIFTDICFDMTGVEDFNWFIEEGYLTTLVPRNTKLQIDTTSIRKSRGDFIQKDAQIAIDKMEITRAAVEEMIAGGSDRNHWLIFASGVEHVIHCVEMLNHYGISARGVHSNTKDFKMSDSERDKNIRDFKQGKYQAIVNNGILTTGSNIPFIDLIGMLRITCSPGLNVQMLGRGTRCVYAPGYNLTTKEGRLASIAAGPKQDCLVFDFSGNVPRVGPINDPVIPGKKGKGGGEAPVKLCKGDNKDGTICNTWIHASLKLCPHCGKEFEFEFKVNSTSGTEDIVKKVEPPVIKTFKVDKIIYSCHTNRKTKNESLQVCYYSGLRMFKEFICLEHVGYPKHQANEWWRKRCVEIKPPEFIETALLHTDKLKEPSTINVWINKKYPEIIKHNFD